VEFRPRQEGNTLHAILAPKKTAAEREKEREREAKQKAKQERKLAQEKEKPVEKPATEVVPDAEKEPVAAAASSEAPNPVSQT
jgi:membrane protein involved in colicin uptake